MVSCEIWLARRELVAKDTMAFYFDKPPEFRHLAGQSLTMTLIDPPQTGGEGDARTFTIAAAPHEPRLMIATRMRDTAFRRVLMSMPIGAAGPRELPAGHE